MKKFFVFFAVFCLSLVFCLQASAQVPIEQRPKFKMKHCDVASFNKISICLDWEYFMDEIELVTDHSIYGPMPNRIDEFPSVRRAISEGIADEYEFYSDKFAQKINLDASDIKLLNERGLDKIARIKFKNIDTKAEMGKWLAVFLLDYNIKSIYFYSVVKTVDHTADPLVAEQGYLEREHFHDAHKDEEAGFGSLEIHTTIFDTGYDNRHEDLPQLAGWFDHITKRTLPSDFLGHGTAVAGVMMQIPNNNKGGIGVSPGVNLWVRKVLADSGDGTWDALAEAIVAQTKVCKNLRDVNPNVRCTFNFSVTGLGPVPSIDAVLDFAYNEGIVGVAGAGNSPVSLDRVKFYPAAKKGTIPVSALDKNGNLAKFTAVGLEVPTVAAEGVDVLVSVPKDGHAGNNRGYKNWSGTSFATPQVVGAINLVWSKRRNLSANQIRLLTLGSSDPIAGLERFVTSGGRLNALMMLDDPSGMPEAPINFRIKNTSHISIETVHTQLGKVLGHIHYISEERFDENTTERSNVTEIQIIKPNTTALTVQTMRTLFLKENTKYYRAIRSFDRFNMSALSPVLETVTKKSEVFAIRTFTSESGEPDPGQWFVDYGPLISSGVLLYPIPWHLSNVLRQKGRETDVNWRFGRVDALDYFVGLTDAVVKSEIFDLRGLNGASMSFEYFQSISLLKFGDIFQVSVVPLNNFNKEIDDTILLKEYDSADNSKSFEMTEQFLDLSSVAGKKFRIVFRVLNPSTGVVGGNGWIFGNVKIYTDKRIHLY